MLAARSSRGHVAVRPAARPQLNRAAQQPAKNAVRGQQTGIRSAGRRFFSTEAAPEPAPAAPAETPAAPATPAAPQKPPGMSFEGFPKTLTDGTIQYFEFPNPEAWGDEPPLYSYFQKHHMLRPVVNAPWFTTPFAPGTFSTGAGGWPDEPPAPPAPGERGDRRRRKKGILPITPKPVEETPAAPVTPAAPTAGAPVVAPAPGAPLPATTIEYARRRLSLEEGRILITRHFCLATDYTKEDPTGWWLMEKLGGVRVIWDGHALWTRTGLRINAPRFFYMGLPPNIWLDGELWAGRGKGKLDDVVNTINSRYRQVRRKKESDKPEEKEGGEAAEGEKKKKRAPRSRGVTEAVPAEELWQGVRFIVHDIPIYPTMPYESRLETLERMDLGQYAKVAPKQKCQSREHLEQYLTEVAAAGGEGVLLQKPNSGYISGASHEAQIYRATHEEDIMFIDRYMRNKGLLSQQRDGNVCVASCPKSVFENPPPRGSVITVRYNTKYEYGKIKNPRLAKVRTDIRWKDIVENMDALGPIIPFNPNDPSITFTTKKSGKEKEKEKAKEPKSEAAATADATQEQAAK